MKLTWVTVATVGMMLALPVGTASAEEPQSVAAALKARQAERWPIFGVMGDVGLPDGAMASLVVRPWQWFRVYGGGGSNSVSPGWRGGLSLIPFGAGPSFSFEYGHYKDGDANGVVRRVASKGFEGSPLLEKIGYDYANAHVGLDFGGRRAVFYVHGGISKVWAQVHNVNEALQSKSSAQSQTTVQIAQDPKITVVGSSLKVGLIIFIL
jgi:hypothetical protein